MAGSLLVLAMSVPSGGSAAATPPVTVPELAHGSSVAFVVFDQVGGRPVVEAKAHRRFRSASLVKLLIALDYLQSRDPASVIPAEDLALLESMLRSSDDTAASILWVRGGFEEIIARMVPRLGLTDTAPPANRRIWGYTAVSAADVVKIYRYLLDEAAPHIRDFMLSNLRQATQCATDGFDQYFGIPRAVPPPWAIKQGWSGYGAVPPPGQECQPSRSEYSDNALALLAAKDAPAALLNDLIAGGAESEIDLSRPAMHTSMCPTDTGRSGGGWRCHRAAGRPYPLLLPTMVLRGSFLVPVTFQPSAGAIGIAVLIGELRTGVRGSTGTGWPDLACTGCKAARCRPGPSENSTNDMTPLAIRASGRQEDAKTIS